MPGIEGLMVSFDDVILLAESEDEAYALGAHLLKKRGDSGADDSGHYAGQFLNDYVVEVLEKEITALLAAVNDAT